MKSNDPGKISEFGLIKNYFRQLAAPQALDMEDDGAVYTPPPGKQLVFTSDTIIEGRHFFTSDPPALIARKLLRCNLSDLAAMGSVPAGWLLDFSAPKSLTPQWVEHFCQGLAFDQQHYKLGLWGGDTTQTSGPLVCSATLIGVVDKGKAIRRNCARVGDGVWVTGTIGDGALGLQALLGHLKDEDGFFTHRYHLPIPRLGLPLSEYASSAMDISDGLIQDADHIARASGVHIEIDVAKIPLSPQAQKLDSSWMGTILTGGDDYEILFTVPPHKEKGLLEHPYLMGRDGEVKVTRIGQCLAGSDQVTLSNYKEKTISAHHAGWRHFS